MTDLVKAAPEEIKDNLGLGTIVIEFQLLFGEEMDKSSGMTNAAV